MISASVFGFMSLTLPGVSACTISAGSTRRTVTGIMAGVPGSASRSTTPKGEAANLARGVFELGGQLDAELGVLGERRAEARGADDVVFARRAAVVLERGGNRLAA